LGYKNSEGGMIMKEKVYTSVFDLNGKELERFIEKYGDIFEPRHVDFEYYKMYYLGKYDPLIHIFNSLAQTYEIKKVVYPGSFIHISPSFSFEDVTYIDVYDNIDEFFTEPDIKKYLNLHKIYKNDTKMTFYHKSYTEVMGSYDLIISSNSGSISIDCKHLMKKGSLLLVNNGHSDADNAFEDDDYNYLGFFKFSGNKEHISFIIEGERECNKSNTYYLFEYIGE